MKKILYGLLTSSLVVGAIALGSSAFFSDTETSLGNTFSSGQIDLYVQSKYLSGPNSVINTVLGSWDFPNNEALFNLIDLKPGDTGQVEFSPYVVSNPAWMCAAVTPTSGVNSELAEMVSVRLREPNGYVSAPLALSTLVSTGWLPLTDATNDWLTNGNGAAEPNTFYPFVMEYCFGSFGSNAVEDCDLDPNVEDYNDAELESIVAQLDFYAVQERNNESFSCVAQNSPQ